MLALLLVGLLLLHTGSCQPGLDPYEELMASTKQFEEAFKNQDPVAVASFYAEDCTVLPPLGEPIRGREGVVQFQKMLMEAGVKDLKFEHYDIDFTADGEMGNFWSVVTFLDANNDVIDTVKALTTTCRENGEMKVDDSVLVGTIFTTLASKSMRDTVEAVFEKWEEAWKNHDVEGIVDGMTDDGICMLPGMDVVKGKEEARKATEEMFSTLGDTEVDYELEELQMIDHKWSYGWGYYTITDSSKKVVDKGKYLSVGVLEDGVVKDHRFMMNSNVNPTTCAGPRDEL